MLFPSIADVDGFTSKGDVDGKDALTTLIDEFTTPTDEICALDDALGAARAKVELLFPSTIEADCFRSGEDVEGKVLLSANVDEITTPTDELCTLDDSLKTD